MPGDRGNQLLIDPSWKVLNPVSSSSIALIVLIFASLYKGLLSQNTDYKLSVQDSVSVQRGLCVHIPCNFTYNAADRRNPQKLYGYWFRGSRYLVATNDDKQRYPEGHFKLTDDLEQGSCSFSILDAKSNDQGWYYFRIEDNSFGYSYINYHQTHKKLQILITEFAEKPRILNSSAVLSGEEAVFTCSVLGPCSKMEPRFFWISRQIRHETPYWSHQQINGSWIYGSNFTFTPSLSDQGKELTCKVWYPNIWEYAENTFLLDIADPPKTVEISTNATNQEHLALCLPDAKRDVDSAVAREGESIHLVCKADGRPDPTLSWRKGNKTLSETKQGKEYILPLMEVRPEDAGQYQCQAETSYSSANKSLQLCVLYRPRLCSQSRSTCWQKDNILHCNCCLDSWPKPQIRWEVDGRKPSEGNPPITSMDQENEVISTLRWTTENPDKNHSIICFGTNLYGAYTLHFLLSPPTKGSHASLAISGLCGALVGVILCVLCLCLIKFYKQRKAKSSSKTSGVEVLNSANGGHQRATDGSLIYSNISSVGQKSPRVDYSKAGTERISTFNPRVPSSSVADPEELYYATLEFSKLKDKERTAPEESVDYSAVKQK
ncbi:sialic acid-binding Ig-like lectin 5 [Eublepharis macularius]|uniref:Sialic acid-binding Ig-like lectin 5 n=1 Tax=Eublepharis macularius TaxID=481883 RepID=A0AA97KDG6_EUBMA|nr:sialic acid-binding Ig-like lectin 5 [Eublepharis macularius]